MIISTNRKPSLESFEDLCKSACQIMNDKAQSEPDYYLEKGAQKLETEVKYALDIASEGTDFEGTIEIISGQRFPDIVAAKYYGIEVKSTKEDKWTLIGGSVAEGTRVENVEHIFFLFGKLHKPVEFRTRRYEECLCDIAVTHSPRYKIDMNLPEGETIFDKIGISYDDMRKLPNPIRPVVDYFRSTLKPGESLWWVNVEEDKEEPSVSPKIRLWKTLSSEEKDDLIAQGFALFPELFSTKLNKYERFTLWLVANHGIVSTSMRDSFSAGGKEDIEIDGKLYKNVPQKYYQLAQYGDKVKDIILRTDKSVLINSWSDDDFEDRIEKWIELVSKASGEDSFEVAKLLEDVFEYSPLE